MRRRPYGLGVAAVAVAAVMMTPGTAHAADKNLRLRGDVPMTAAGGTATCPGVPGDKDGWHIGVRNHPRVKLTSMKVTFDPGGEQTITGFADATNAYVASERGAKLTGASAVVDGSLVTLLLVNYIVVEGTCPGQAPPPPPPAPAPEQPAPNQNPQPNPQPENDNGGGNDNANGGNTGKDKDKNGDAKKPGKKPSTKPTTPGVTPSTTGLPPLDDVEQPEIDVNSDNGTPVAAIQPDTGDQAGGLGIAGFATIAMGAFLLLFGGVSGYVNWKRRRG